MAVPEKGPQRWVVPSLGHNSSRDGAQSRFSQKERQSAFPMGRRPKGNFTKTSSYLLHQLVQPYQDSDGEGEEGEGDWESEESSVSEMPKLEEEFDGVLREETVADALHNLGRSGLGTEQVYLDLCLSGFDLADIRILSRYVHLQKLDLSKNKIEDLSCVSCMPYLLELNASQNKLTTFFDFKPPKNLKKVDFSFNQISEMCDLSAYHALTKLILDNNEIEEITGLEMCNSLTHLSLANNKISVINGLNMLPIKILCLNNNQIEKITGLENLKTLQNLDLSHNQISSLQGLENHDLLEVLDLEDNKVAQLSEIEYIENLPILRILNLLRNPIQDKTDYWLFVIFMLLQLTELDQKKIEVEEKVAAVNKYDPPPEVVAARDHLTHVVNSMMQPQRIFDSTLPSLDAPYPMLILAGPEACGKRELAHRLCRQFNTFFRYGACHTTRPPYFGEGDRVDYHFISQEVFDEMLNMGKFILTFNYGNHSYGLNRDTVEGIARDGLASCIHMEIEGVRSLKYSYFEPRYILVVPMNKEKYEGYLRRKGLFSRAEIEFAVSRVDLYIKINHKFPGYFDAVINADDLDAAYQKLSQLIREYLGLAEEPAKTLAPTAAGASSSRKTASGVPAHLVPSPRRLAKLQADGQTGEEPSGAQTHAAVPEPQDPAPAQSPAPTREEEAPGERPASTGPADPAAPAPRRGQDASPDGKDAEARRSPRSPAPVTAEPHVPGLEAPRPEAGAAEAPPAPPAPVSPQPEPDAESGEARGALGDPPPPEPAPLGPQEVHEEETQPAQAPLPEPPRPDPAGAEARRASTPYPGPPPRQDAAAHSQQRPGGEQPAAGPPRSRRAPTRLPQPQTLAPLQSRRPTPKRLSPGGDQAPPPAREGTPGRLPPLSPPHSKPPPKPGAPAARSPRPGPGEEAGEVKLPRISPPSQDQAPDPSREGEAPPVRLPRIAPPPPPGATPGRPEAEPAAGRGAPKAPAQPRGPRKRALPTLREPAAGPARPGKAARVASRQQPERPGPGPPPPAAPRPGDPQPQPEKQRKGHHPRKGGASTTAPAPEGDGGAGSTQDSDAPEAAREPSGTGSAPAGRPAQKTDPESPEPGSSATAPAPRSRRPTGEPSSHRDLALPSRQQAEGKRVPRQGGASRERGSGPQGSAEEERGSRAGRRARGSQSTKV